MSAVKQSRSRPKRVAEEPAVPYGSLRLLLDTHVWLWWRTDDRRLGVRARGAIVDAAEVFVSAASAWEIAIKASAGKLKIPRGVSFDTNFDAQGFRPLAVDFRHADAVRALPPLHRDPFDRMLIAQAQVEGLTLATVEPLIQRYAVSVLLA